MGRRPLLALTVSLAALAAAGIVADDLAAAHDRAEAVTEGDAGAAADAAATRDPG